MLNAILHSLVTQVPASLASCSRSGVSDLGAWGHELTCDVDLLPGARHVNEVMCENDLLVAGQPPSRHRARALLQGRGFGQVPRMSSGSAGKCTPGWLATNCLRACRRSAPPAG